jgi:hypothetical protein
LPRWAIALCVDGEGLLAHPIPIRLQRRGGRKLIMTPEGAAPTPKATPRRDPDQGLVRAHRWRRRIESGQANSITDLAEQEGVTDAYVCRLLSLTCFAPDIVEAILDGRQPRGLRLSEMLGNGPLHWGEQRARWGLREPCIAQEVAQLGSP